MVSKVNFIIVAVRIKMKIFLMKGAPYFPTTCVPQSAPTILLMPIKMPVPHNTLCCKPNKPNAPILAAKFKIFECAVAFKKS